MIKEREQVVVQLEQLEDIKESEMIETLAADNEAGNAGVISNPIMSAAVGHHAYGESSAISMGQSQMTAATSDMGVS